MFAVKERAIFTACVLFGIHRLDQVAKSANHSGTAIAIIRVGRANAQVTNSKTALFSTALHKFPTI
jgi:hypothetical protein